jgi:hypothetical protein
LFFLLIFTLLLRGTTLLGRTLLRSLPLGCALSLGSLSAFIRALFLRSAMVLLLKSALTGRSPLLRGTLSFSCPARGSLVSARRSGWRRLWRASGRALRYGCLWRPRSRSWWTGALLRRSRHGRPGGPAALFSVLWTLSRD